LKTYDQSCNFQNELQGNSHFQGFRKTHVSDFRICSKTGFWSLWNFVGFWIYRSLANRLELKVLSFDSTKQWNFKGTKEEASFRYLNAYN